jgi:peptidoglycan hydrolase CwlO-like protein
MEENSRRIQEQKDMMSHFDSEIKGKQDHVIELKRTIDSRQKLLAELRLIVRRGIDPLGREVAPREC